MSEYVIVEIAWVGMIHGDCSFRFKLLLGLGGLLYCFLWTVYYCHLSLIFMFDSYDWLY